MTTEDYRELVNARLEELLSQDIAYPALKEAMHYSIAAGGKRLRPVMNLMANAMFGGSLEECLDVACAIEMIHTYSLIHDDLPAMDNDELRRGRPTSHVMFGEAFAVLAGDGLQGAAYAVMIDNALRYVDNAERHLRAMRTVARGAGVQGMLAGQSADIESDGRELTEHELRFIHTHKTGDMITASLVSGAELAGAKGTDIDMVRAFGEHIGVAFQIVDDILDVEGSSEELGKTPGKDERDQKYTFPRLFGVEASRRMAEENTQQAVDALRPLGEAGGPLRELALRMLRRNT
ncbi:MAG: polyprenyl synthetase family protein [Clostridia bacterium]|nr:polyprenyl synthetase family protein [Clostridia bacterium]